MKIRFTFRTLRQVKLIRTPYQFFIFMPMYFEFGLKGESNYNLNIII